MMQRLLLGLLMFFNLNVLGQFPGCPDVDAGLDQNTLCPSTCVTLTAAPVVSGQTTSYSVSSINYAPPIAYNAPGGVPISVDIDDVWSPIVQLPFNFCYYGQTYTNCRVGSNGAIRMGTAGTTGGNHPWMFNAFVPSNDLADAGNIFGIYHDIDPSVEVPGGGLVRWYLLGEAPCRVFVVSFYEMAHFYCNNLRSTHMMVLYETTNVIDVYVEKKQTCGNWNNGRAVIGIQNMNGTQGIAAPGRNTGPWTITTPEAWRFTPSGAPIYSVSWAAGGQVISNNLSVQVCPTATTNYTATISYTPCAGGVPVVVTDNVTVNVNQGVVPAFQSTQTYCQGATINALPSTSTNGISGTWSPAINNQQTTTYTFTPNPNQCASPVQLAIPITQTITPTFNLTNSHCIGANITNLPTTSLNGVSGTWSPAINNQQTTNYTFTPSVGACSVPVQQTIAILPIVTPSFNAVGPLCQGTAIPALPTNSLNGIAGIWSPAINNQQTTTYTFTPVSGACATGPITLTIVITPNVNPIFDPIAPYCENSIIPNLPTTSLNGITGTWSPVINNQQTTIYTFTATSSGCFNQANNSIEILPLAFSNAPASACANELPFLWNSQNLMQTGNYSAVFIAANGCDSTANLNFTVLPVLESTTVANICIDQIPYSWNGLQIVADGLYTVVLNSSFGCDSIANLNATIRPLPEVSFFADVLTGCGNVLTIFTNTSELPFVSCHWLFGDGTTSSQCGSVSKLYDTPGSYDVTLRLTTQYGCMNELKLTEYITVYPNPVASFIINPIILSTFNLTADFINLSSNFNMQFWDFGHEQATSSVLSPSYTYPDLPAQYLVWLYLENEFGCTDSTSNYVNVVIEPVYYVPNTFSPDGDKFNNIFFPIFSSGYDPYDYKLLIFNRWGEVLFESNNAAIGWDGTYGGQICQDGVYVYQIVFKEDFTDKRHILKGHVNLLR